MNRGGKTDMAGSDGECICAFSGRFRCGTSVKSYFLLLLRMIFALFLLMSAVASAAEHQLLVEPPGTIRWKNGEISDIPSPGQVRRWRHTTLNPLVTTSDGLSKGDVLQVVVSQDSRYLAVVDRITRNVNGTVTVRARIDDHPFGYVLVSTTKGRSVATISIPEKGRQFMIRHSASGHRHYMLDMAAIDALEGGPSIIAPPADELDRALKEPLAPPAYGPSDPALIDVMIVYTPAARAWAGGAAGIANLIAQAMEKAQLALDNSNTLISVRLVHSAEVDYTESGVSSTDLARLRIPDDGYMDSVHELRDEHGADLVSLFASVSDAGGVGYLLNTTLGSPSFGFSLTRVQQAGWTYTHIHEMGHNMGLHHHKLQNTQPGPGLFPYSAGWRWVGSNSVPYCSIMTYESGTYFQDGVSHTRVAYISNPDLLHQGAIAGDATNADNARTLREIKHVIAGYRSAQPLAEAINQPTWAVSTGGSSPWQTSEAESHDGVSSAQSGPISHNQESWMQTTLLGSGRISFYWKVSSEGGWDFLEFYIDGVLQDRISGSVQWTEKIFDVFGGGVHTIRWRYVKDGSVSSGVDRGWVDQVVWMPLLAEAINQPSWSVTTGGHGAWSAQTAVTYDGVSAAESADIADSQESWMQTTVQDPGIISFYWKVSSEANWDFLEFYVDGVLKQRISGTVEWTERSFVVSGPGMHTIRWRYVKDSSISSGMDCGWVDAVSWQPLPPVVTQVRVNAGDVQRSRILVIEMAFSHALTIDADQAFLLKTIDGQFIDLTAAQLEQEAGSDVAALYLHKVKLEDGVYELHLLPAAFVDASGSTLDVDGDGISDGATGKTLAVPFHSLLGDIDGDRAVTVRDVLAVRSLVGSTIEQDDFNPGADVNADGAVTGTDMRIVNGRVGTFLP